MDATSLQADQDAGGDNKRASLIKQLRIDRDVPATSGRGRAIRWVLGVAFVVVAAAAATSTAVSVMSGPSLVTVRAAVATPVSASTTGAGDTVLDASGYVVARRQATVSSKITGRVTAVLIEEGREVKENEVIARLDDSNYAAAVLLAKHELAEAKANLEAARLDYENERSLFQRQEAQLRLKVTSQQAFDTAKASFDRVRSKVDLAQHAVEVAEARLLIAQRNLEDTVVRAPFDGVVTVKAAQEGEIVSPMSAGGGFTRTGIGTIVDMDSLEVEVDVSENFITRVQPAQPATIRLSAYPDWSIPGSVIATIPTADRAKATVTVRVRLEERDARVLPEMGAQVAFLTAAAESLAEVEPPPGTVTVPQEAIYGQEDDSMVFVINDDKVESVHVRLGDLMPDGRRVVSGVTAGTRVAIGDSTALHDGTRIRIAN
jgi:RND family efflux transporter MFP subunit